jgi:hypothetical protein
MTESQITPPKHEEESGIGNKDWWIKSLRLSHNGFGNHLKKKQSDYS